MTEDALRETTYDRWGRDVKHRLRRLAGEGGGQLFRYLAVGAWNTVFGYSMFAGLTYVLTGRVAHAYMVAYAVASFIAIGVAFLLYKFVVFRTKGNSLREFLRMNAVYGATTLLGFALLPVLVLATSAALNPRWAPYVAQAILMPITIFAGFIGHKRFSFRRGEGDLP